MKPPVVGEDVPGGFLAGRDQILTRLLVQSPVSIVLTDTRGTICYANPRFCALTGYDAAEVVGSNPRLLKTGHTTDAEYRAMWQQLSAGVPWHGEFLNRKKNGDTYWEDARIMPIHDEDGHIVQYLGIKEDITERKRMLYTLEQLAYQDALTGLANRSRLLQAIEAALPVSPQQQSVLALCCIDLDDFAGINREYGQDTGDRVLCRVAAALQQKAGADAVVARLGGDEFAILLPALPSDQAEAALSGLLSCISSCALPGQGLTASMGILLHARGDNGHAEHLLRHADEAMFAAKHAGGACHRLFKTSDAEALHGQAFRQALAGDEFEIHFQPVVDASGRTVSAEALLRWRQHDGSLRYPDSFLPALVQSGLMPELDEHVLVLALAASQRLAAAGQPLPISVNLHASTLLAEGFVLRLAECLEGGALSGLITLEILENAALGDLDRAAGVIRACRSLGVAVAIDDFGVGHASLSHLHQLPVSTLKIDRSFVLKLLSDRGARAIVEAIASLARVFGLGLIAEGVETPAHRDALLGMGPMLLQGYAIARPMPEGALLPWLQACGGDPA
ncbi:putative bifunctional diguanylate cyclase/phosphodiesterase [Craterilacuibacter sp.]|uniref:putative bifunctional diguanylate cyclase/phosphodiesterase n=1 Tax=Craterilacuibacter sp. TaxID=2870909 RepID=UPI003F2B273D